MNDEYKDIWFNTNSGNIRLMPYSGLEPMFGTYYTRKTETIEDELEKMPIDVIERFLRKKKIENLKKL